MKKLNVYIHAELEIPDDWEIVEHADGIEVLKVGNSFVDFDIQPMSTRETKADANWSDEDQALTEQVLDAVRALGTRLEPQ